MQLFEYIDILKKPYDIFTPILLILRFTGIITVR